jgi:hypothetical protein
MAVFINLPRISNQFFSSFSNFTGENIESNFEVSEEGDLYFLVSDGLVKIKDDQCTLYKFEKKISKFSKILLTNDNIICFIEEKIYFVDKGNPEKCEFVYNNVQPIIGRPCRLGEDIYFSDAVSVKKLSIASKKLTELYRFKVEGKIFIHMANILKHAGRIVFFDRIDSLIFLNSQDTIDKRIQFPIKEVFVSKNTALNLKEQPTKFSSIQDGKYKILLNINLNVLPIQYKNMLFLKGEKSAICIDENLEVKILKGKNNIELLVPNKKGECLKPIKDISSLSLRERTQYEFDLGGRVLCFYSNKFALVLREKVLSVKTEGAFKDYLLDQYIDAKDLFGWVSNEEVHVVIMDSYGEIYKFKTSAKYIPKEDNFDIRFKARSPGLLTRLFKNIKNKLSLLF